MNLNFRLSLSAIILCFLAQQAQCQQEVQFLSENPNYPFSEVVKVGDMYYLSGQIGYSNETEKVVEGGIGPETKQTMQSYGNSFNSLMLLPRLIEKVMFTPS